MARNEGGEAARDGDGAKGADPGVGVEADVGGQGEPEPGNRLRFVGLGLIGSLVIGYSPLRDAMQGNGSFENAMFRFLACFVACMVAASIIGRILDGAPPPETAAAGPDEMADGTTGDDELDDDPRDDGRSTVDASAEANE